MVLMVFAVYRLHLGRTKVQLISKMTEPTKQGKRMANITYRHCSLLSP